MVDLPPPVETTVHIADDKDHRIRDYATLEADQFASGIPRPDANNRFEHKPVMFQMLQTMRQFGGSTAEDPHTHLKSFLEVADSFHIPGVAEDVCSPAASKCFKRWPIGLWIGNAIIYRLRSFSILGVHFRISGFSDIRISDIRKFRIRKFTIRIRIRNSGYPKIRISEIPDSDTG
ncbi:hypothetical protein OSB04_004511 [Centaurea solstitialis]|uniref:Uncharacterized protein n=1 Tax=Centaurea solstitialis TaxID=347529 RepID=A0AA38TWY7_9ASTR|nr:hypothetical protein OSB04_004511 [Centaurea solstitialis]